MTARPRATSLALLLLAACPAPPPAVSCTASSDCSPLERCMDGRCRPDPTRSRVPLDSGVHPPDSGPPDTGATVLDGGAQPDATTGCAMIEVVGGAMHCTLAEALAAAPRGATVRVPAGRFTETAVITVPVTLRGRGLTMTSLAPPAGAGPSLRIGASGAVVEHLAIEASGRTGIEVTEDALLRSVKVSGAGEAAIVVSGTSTVTFEALEIDTVARNGAAPESGAGVRFGPFTGGTFRGGTITRTGGPAVFAQRATIDLHGVRIEGNAAGVLVEDATTLRVDSMVGAAVIRTNGAYGVRAHGGSVEIRNIDCADNGRQGGADGHGLALKDGVNAIVEGSSFSGNQGYGMFCDANVAPRCMDNRFSGNGAGNSSCTGTGCR